MEIMVICSEMLKLLMISIFSYFVYMKIINYKENSIYKTFFVIFCSINISLVYLIFREYLNSLNVMLLLLLVYGIILNKFIIKDDTFNSIITYVSSCMISYLIYLVSTILSGIFILLFMPRISSRNPVSLLIIPTIGIIILLLLFKTKRFKNGISFFKKLENNSKLIRSIMCFFILTIVIFYILQNKNDTMLNIFVIIETIIISVLLIAWIKNQITKTYKTKMRDRTIEIQKTEIDEKNKKIEEIKTENLKLATAIHKYNHKFEALELAMKKALNLESKTEFAEELSVILKEVNETSKNFAKATEINMVKLPETNISGIDNMFKYMQEEASKNNINFDLKINTTINPLIDNIIPKEKFEILIADHLKDAIIAVNLSDKSYKSILVILGLVDGGYEFSVYDTGIEFEIDTLLKLGKEQVTTHKETGGSGIGFMTTFETLKECKGSLIIEEYNPETTSYTKSVTIKFDGKNKYKICSYRAEKIKEQKPKRRIIIQKLK